MHAQNFEARVLKNEPRAADVWLLEVALPEEAALPKAGQFYMLRAWGRTRRRFCRAPSACSPASASGAVWAFCIR